MRPRTLLPLLCLAMAVVGCSGSNKSKAEPTPTPDNPATRAARAEEDFQGGSLEKEEGQFRTEARNAVAAFVKANLPGWTIKGIASQPYDQNIFSMDADLVREDKQVVITFEVRKFFSESGEGYWLAVPVNKYRMDRLHAMTDAELRRELSEAQEQLNNPPEPESEEPADYDPY